MPPEFQDSLRFRPVEFANDCGNCLIIFGAGWFDGDCALRSGEEAFTQILIFKQVDYVGCAAPMVSSRSLSVLVAYRLGCRAAVGLIARGIEGLESSGYRQANCVVH